MANKVLLKLKNGYISDIDDDFDKTSGGCPTCGLDEEYISKIKFKIHDTDDTYEWFEVTSCDYLGFSFSVADIIKLLIFNIDEISNMDIVRFKNWIETELLDTNY